MDKHHRRIKRHYQRARGDSTALFQAILAAADDIGLEQALAFLEQCVIEKRLAWLNQNQDKLTRTGDPVYDGYRLFYEVYLGVSIPADGEIVERTRHKMVTRWWNHCPTLEICQKLGLDTQEICRLAYHQPVQAFLAKIHPGLRFERNYECLRPHTTYCEEIILLEE